ncbi:MAG TPA: hypothetical protein PKD85_01360 [Saprospiraceae bacterium]|nr:hypothetical protein [Saprospiraceae bacterium]
MDTSPKYPASIEDALNMDLKDLAQFGDFGGVMISNLEEITPKSTPEEKALEELLSTQFNKDSSKYPIYNLTSLGNMARIIVSGKNSRLVAKAQECYDDYKEWYVKNTANSAVSDFMQYLYSYLVSK